LVCDYEVPQGNTINGYEVGKGEYIALDPEELEAVAIESKPTGSKSSTTSRKPGRRSHL
jgi:non-homologous end joining protein Ku